MKFRRERLHRLFPVSPLGFQKDQYGMRYEIEVGIARLRNLFGVARQIASIFTHHNLAAE